MRESAIIVGKHETEIREGKRFEFGENWAKFLRSLNDQRIERARSSLSLMLGIPDLKGLRLLDIGCGSGLFSLAARQLGASVHSFDFDPKSVACTRELRRRYFPSDQYWTIEEASVLNSAYMVSLGTFDIVYSWGVLHHTGAMWEAIGNSESRVGESGRLYIALYNDQGRASRYWWWTKRAYVALPKPLRFLVMAPCLLRLWGPTMMRDLFMLKPFATWRNYGMDRGMSPVRDVVDWVGGFPFEVCKPEEIFDYFKSRNFELEKLKTCAGGHACNEFVFRRKVRSEAVAGR